MDSTNNESTKKKKRNYYFIITITLFVSVIGLSILLWFVDNKLQNSIDSNNHKISEYTKQIGELKSNSSILSYDIVKENSTEIQSMINKSAVQKHIDNLITLSKKFTIQFKGFSFDGDKIVTNASVVGDTKIDSMLATSNFIKAFRSSDALKSDINVVTSLYELNPISTIGGDYTNRTFGISLSIK